MTPFVLVTALIVSIDAMAAGFALAMKGALTSKIVLIIGLITFLLCTPAALGGEYLEGILGDNVNIFGGLLLILIGLRNLTPAINPPPAQPLIKKKRNFDAVAVGVAVGLDAAVANLSISIMGNHSLVVPLIFAAMHIIAVGIGYTVLSFFRRSKGLDITSALILAGVGFYKLIAALVGM